ncbi:AfsA-related hotdog domain-containing protein [Streptomyces sp. NPDC001435]|uniref:AfsA-related hotdog domain-containing protein n=1 Tax=unclassified Streptomyces TaxID=2593676 RepID=UPI0036B53FF5
MSRSTAQSMSPDAVIAVGDRFEDFLVNRGTVPVSDLLARLRSGDVPESLAVAIGQGLSDEQLAEIRTLADRHAPAVTVAKSGVPERARQQLTHKHDAKNVLIGPVGQIGENRFAADLVLDQRVEVLEDHLTGQHIPAITLLEAARQFWTVVTEQFYVTGPDRTRFVIGSVGSTFHSFVFPLAATLQYELLELTRTPVGPVFKCRISIHHGDTLASVIDAEYRVIPEPFSVKQEKIAARQAVVAELTRLRDQAAPAMSGGQAA